MRIAYVCDGAGCGHERKSCETLPAGCGGRCTHTTDPAHAVNGACDDPWNYPGRFAEIAPGKYYEIEPGKE